MLRKGIVTVVWETRGNRKTALLAPGTLAREAVTRCKNFWGLHEEWHLERRGWVIDEGMKLGEDEYELVEGS